MLFIFVLEDNFAILCNENIDASALACRSNDDFLCDAGVAQKRPVGLMSANDEADWNFRTAEGGVEECGQSGASLRDGKGLWPQA